MIRAEKLAIAKEIRNGLKSRFSVDCFSVKNDDGTPSGKATETCDIAIDFFAKGSLSDEDSNFIIDLVNSKKDVKLVGVLNDIPDYKSGVKRVLIVES